MSNSQSIDQNDTSKETRAISILDFLAESEIDNEPGSLEVLRLGVEPVFVSFFTSNVVDEPTHFLDGTETWTRGYYRCLGDSCPACQAGLERKRYLLLPVVDRVDGRVKVIRIPVMKGPGKLLTEVGKIFTAPDCEKLIVQITRNRDFTHNVSIQNSAEIDPEVAAAAQRFTTGVEDDSIDIGSVTTLVSVEDMAGHEKIARLLELQGKA